MPWYDGPMIAVLMPTILPSNVDQRPAAVAGIHGGVGLQELLDDARR